MDASSVKLFAQNKLQIILTRKHKKANIFLLAIPDLFFNASLTEEDLMNAIRTRLSEATPSRGPRISATDADGNHMTIPAPSWLDLGDAHAYAAYTLMKKMHWPNELYGGYFGVDMYWVMSPKENREPEYIKMLSFLGRSL